MVRTYSKTDFEDGTGPDGPFKPNSYGFMSLLPGSTTIPSWTVTGTAGGLDGEDVAWLRNDNQAGVPDAATDGSHFLDLTGSNDKRGPDRYFGGVTQTFPTVVGFDYHVFLDIGVFNNTSVPMENFPGPISVIVGSWGGRRPSLGGYVTVTGPTDGATAAVGLHQGETRYGRTFPATLALPP